MLADPGYFHQSGTSQSCDRLVTLVLIVGFLPVHMPFQIAFGNKLGQRTLFKTGHRTGIKTEESAGIAPSADLGGTITDADRRNKAFWKRYSYI